MKIIPIKNRIYFKPEDATSILITTTGNKKEKGLVLAVGKDVEEVKVGDTIIYTPWGVDVYEENGEKYYFATEDSTLLLARVEM